MIQALAAAKPDILVLSSHIQDGIAFRRAFLAVGLQVKVFMGTTIAQCDQDFGDVLGSAAVGVFASDRPQGTSIPTCSIRRRDTLYDRFAALWKQRTGEAAPDEEGIAGFSAAWVLVGRCPRAGRGRQRPKHRGRGASARSSSGSLPNGGGDLFSTVAGQLGQNIRAAAVVWQWQAPRHSVVVWPPVYATGQVRLALSTS